VQAAYGKLPLSFEANHGQTAPQVQFLARGRGYSLFLTSQEAVLAFSQSADQHTPAAEARAMTSAQAVVRMQLIGA